jgi:hypothetical protein
MIDKREILETASSLILLPNVVEKDYVLGWLLAGIYAHLDACFGCESQPVRVSNMTTASGSRDPQSNRL